jgi:hypothetical protein
LLTKIDHRGAPFLDELAQGLESGAISRGKAIKLGGAVLVGSALAGLFASRADAVEEAQTVETALNKRQCEGQGGDFCQRSGCKACCGKGGQKRKACCGRRGCSCCRRSQGCDEGRCGD